MRHGFLSRAFLILVMVAIGAMFLLWQVCQDYSGTVSSYHPTVMADYGQIESPKLSK